MGVMLKKNSKISVTRRRHKITELLRDNQEVNIPELAQLLGTSEMTIRRDLDLLAEQGYVRRTHGGAAAAERMEFQFDFVERRIRNHKAKQMIAAEAVKLIMPGQRIILDTGTTTLELACLLKNFERLTVITPSLAVASVLQFSTGIQTILLGGVIRKGSPDLTGVVAEKVLDMFMVDIAFQGADGIGLNGELFNSDMRIAQVDTKMRQRAEKTYILCDSSKVGKLDFASNGSLSEVNALITDSGISNEAVKSLKKLCHNIIICPL
ncbi:MAG: DeoR/GlpR transcriptional regulator [Sedimentisphaerales bacterium]|nr:DeoR/GlpR transcriptional regulator [Sedimentisphaerales bacterium]